VVGLAALLLLAANVALLMPLLHADQEMVDQMGSAGSVSSRGFLESFDADGDGVLSDLEFQRIVAVSHGRV